MIHTVCIPDEQHSNANSYDESRKRISLHGHQQTTTENLQQSDPTSFIRPMRTPISKGYRLALLGFLAGLVFLSVKLYQGNGSLSDVVQSTDHSTSSLWTSPSLRHLSYETSDKAGNNEGYNMNDISQSVSCAAKLQQRFDCADPGCTDKVGGFFNYLKIYYCDWNAVQPLVWIGLIVWLIFLMYLLGNTADAFFCPVLQVIVNVLAVSPNVAGVTFLSFGNGAPDVFSSLAAFMSGEGQVGISAIVGAGVFVTTVVVGCVCLVGEFKLDRRPFLRDVGFYIAATIYLLINFAQDTIHLGETLGFLVIYAAFALTVVVGRTIYQRRKRQRLERNQFLKEMDDTDSNQQPLLQNDTLIKSHEMKEPDTLCLSPTEPQTQLTNEPFSIGKDPQKHSEHGPTMQRNLGKKNSNEENTKATELARRSSKFCAEDAEKSSAEDALIRSYRSTRDAPSYRRGNLHVDVSEISAANGPMRRPKRTDFTEFNRSSTSASTRILHGSDSQHAGLSREVGTSIPSNEVASHRRPQRQPRASIATAGGSSQNSRQRQWNPAKFQVLDSVEEEGKTPSSKLQQPARAPSTDHASRQGSSRMIGQHPVEQTLSVPDLLVPVLRRSKSENWVFSLTALQADHLDTLADVSANRRADSQQGSTRSILSTNVGPANTKDKRSTKSQNSHQASIPQTMNDQKLHVLQAPNVSPAIIPQTSQSLLPQRSATALQPPVSGPLNSDRMDLSGTHPTAGTPNLRLVPQGSRRRYREYLHRKRAPMLFQTHLHWVEQLLSALNYDEEEDDIVDNTEEAVRHGSLSINRATAPPERESSFFGRFLSPVQRSASHISFGPARGHVNAWSPDTLGATHVEMVTQNGTNQYSPSHLGYGDATFGDAMAATFGDEETDIGTYPLINSEEEPPSWYERYLGDDTPVGKSLAYILWPSMLIRQISTPVVEPEDYDWRWCTVSPTLCIPWIIWTALMTVGQPGNAIFRPVSETASWLPWYGVGLFIGGLVSIVCYFRLPRDAPPHGVLLLVLTILSFLGSVAWIVTVASEIVSLLDALGYMLGIPATVLAMTVLAWGNSLGDLVADVTVAKEGIPKMAIAATFAGPCFNLLVGLGLSTTVGLLKHGIAKGVTLQPRDGNGVVNTKAVHVAYCSFGFLLASLISSVGIVLLNKFYMRKWHGIWLLILYVAYLATAFAIQFA